MPPPEDTPPHTAGRVTAADIRGRTRPQVSAEIVHEPPDVSPAEKQVPGPAVPHAEPAGETPDATDYDSPGTVITPQLTAIWTILSSVYGFGSDEKDQARAVCGHIVGAELASTKDMSKNGARLVLDTLAQWRQEADEKGFEPRAYLVAVLAGGEVPDE